jgi:hypothetical protein
MIRHATGRDQAAGVISRDAADVFEEARLEFGGDLRLTVFCAEDDMAMERRKGLRHGLAPGKSSELLSPRWGLIF